MKNKIKNLILKCECLDGENDCGSIHFVPLGKNGDVDIWIGEWKPKYGGIYLGTKSVKKMSEWLSRIINQKN